ncbi:chorismate pyruvate-lyase family protein [Streptococcus gallolyticus]|uniref:chorismate pyruvate-lyase family protein n=1 Tax=Streptococcus gallolyticus TaxID=315405 RepID=UPI002283D0A0|nr:chorismate pyruvate-lyase family protein [Streptococcus gallolyticus]MCY7189442.1 chorismate pyruvate-lyase family protein [Streptococcus gallolyticus subsp. gallolyticus]
MKRDLKKVLDDILFQNTGSTTAILEAVTNKTVEVEIIQENIIHDDRYSNQYNWGDSLMLRATILKAGGIDISDNIVIYDPNKINQLDNFSVQNCSFPIGKVLENIDYRRITINSGVKNANYLSEYCDFFNLTTTKYPVKEYQYIHDNEVYFHIIELYLDDNLLKVLKDTLT